MLVAGSMFGCRRSLPSQYSGKWILVEPYQAQVYFVISPSGCSWRVEAQQPWAEYRARFRVVESTNDSVTVELLDGRELIPFPDSYQQIVHDVEPGGRWRFQIQNQDLYAVRLVNWTTERSGPVGQEMLKSFSRDGNYHYRFEGTRARRESIPLEAPRIDIPQPANSAAAPQQPPGKSESRRKTESIEYRIGNGISAPIVLLKTEPQYSEAARAAKLQGNVMISLLVDERGNPRDMKVIRPLGMGLDENAIKAIRQWKFRPGMKDGHPVAVRAQIEVTFRLL